MPLAQLLEETEPADRSFFARPATEVARDCLGEVLLHGRTAARIVEVEAYLGVDDQASHAFRGITERTRVIYGPPGHAYVYLIYGMYECLNFVSEEEGHAGCILIRAVEPLTGLALMRRRRPAAKRVEDLASGPGKLALAMGITRKLNGSDLVKGPLTVRRFVREEAFHVAATPRIGIRRCVAGALRFIVRDSPFVSR